MSTQLQITPELEERMRAIARDEFEKRLLGVREDWSVQRMQAAMTRLEALRKQVALPPDAVEEIIEEHRREFGRGPLVESQDQPDGD